MTVELRPLTAADAEAHCAGEDELTVRWLTGGYGSIEGTVEAFALLQRNADVGRGKRGFGVWTSGRLCGYVDYDPDNDDGLEPDDVNISYAVHPWARRQGIAVEAVRRVCDVIREDHAGTRAAIRVESANTASVCVAEKAGFTYVRDFASATDLHHDGTPKTFSLFLLDL